MVPKLEKASRSTTARAENEAKDSSIRVLHTLIREEGRTSAHHVDAEFVSSAKYSACSSNTYAIQITTVPNRDLFTFSSAAALRVGPSKVFRYSEVIALPYEMPRTPPSLEIGAAVSSLARRNRQRCDSVTNDQGLSISVLGINDEWLDAPTTSPA